MNAVYENERSVTLKGSDENTTKHCRRCDSDTYHAWVVEAEDTGEGYFECIECGNKK